MFSQLPSGDGSDILSSLEEQGLIPKHELLNYILQIPCKQAGEEIDR